ncbi:site-specific recombinase [Lentibacillus populi]|uniref:Site-specific recombinase n=1 Tax=Lentibacillus populi TaxID=1827502 RepID=A0A9W5U285_9BACI|nr:site-specific integrase [Lentibacillus populi]GGB63202.1 site-specific recombinase [Lentibacillus populi]
MEYVQPIRNKEKIEEVKAILKRKSYRDYLMFVMGINTGLRVSDLLKLQVKDVRDTTHIKIKEKKTDKTKRFKLNTVIIEVLRDYTRGLNDEEFLFPSKKSNKPISRVQAYRILNEAAEKAGLKEIGTHTMRKTFGYHHYQQFKDVALLQQIFNHSAPSVTMRYIGIDQDLMDATIDKFAL